MQIDFHHTVTYVCARMAGFSHEEADIISYSAQYVDEATNDGILKFEGGQKYSRMASAHKMIDRRNFSEAANHKVWVPFHFLPGNGDSPSRSNPNGSFIRKLVCKPNSYVSREILDMCRSKKDKPYALHRLGITMHVFADTFAHQGFAGIQHKINEVNDLELHNEDIDMNSKLKNFFGDFFDSITQKFLSNVVPLGHGPALECPDKPYLKWSYKNGFDELIERDNTEIFMAAVQNMVGDMMLFREDIDASPDSEHLVEDFAKIKSNFKLFTEQRGDERHERWIESIANGDFSFGSENLKFVAKGEGSWKYNAVKIEVSDESDIQDDDGEIEEEYKPEFDPEFLQSNWKLFHDALQAHYFDVVHDILPKYNICVA